MTVLIADTLANTVYVRRAGQPLKFPGGSELIPDRKALDAHRAQSKVSTSTNHHIE